MDDGDSGVKRDSGHGDVRRSDPRLPAYLIAGFGSLLIATATGQPYLAAFGAAFVVLGAIGLGRRVPNALRGEVSVSADRMIEGTEVDGLVRVDWDGTAEVDVMLAGWRGVTPVDPTPILAWSIPTGRGPATLTFRVRATSWGAHELGTLWIRARRPGGLMVREQKLAISPTLRVLPTPLRLDRMLKPAEPRTVAGSHLSRRRGQGTDFADLRPYNPGDRLRDLSWATSARLGAPWVSVRHPERTAAVLLLLDAFLTEDPHNVEGLARAARAAWAVASVHLRAQDRVGLLAKEGAPAWVPPQGGRRARLLLLDNLLAVGRAAEAGHRRRHHSSRRVVPSDALIVGVTGLRSRNFMTTLLHFRRHGHAAAALVIDTSDLLPPPPTRADQAAQRIWAAQREARRFELDRNRIPTALVTADQGVGAAVSALRRRMAGMERSGALVQ